jgi:hypothetical protein
VFFNRKAKTFALNAASFSIKDITENSSLVPQPNLVSPTASENLTISHHASLQTSQIGFDWISNTNAFQRLKNLQTLEDNWDGYKASKFSREQVSRAFDLYSSIYDYYLAKEMKFSQLSPFIAPASDGSILFEWAGKRFPTRELEIFVPSATEGGFEYLKCDSSQEDEGNLSLQEIESLLDWLFDTES